MNKPVGIAMALLLGFDVAGAWAEELQGKVRSVDQVERAFVHLPLGPPQVEAEKGRANIRRWRSVAHRPCRAQARGHHWCVPRAIDVGATAITE